MQILLCGDTPGVSQLLAYIPSQNIVGIIAATIRPQYLKTLKSLANAEKVSLFVQPKWKSKKYREFKRQIINSKSDLILVNSYSMIIREDILSAVRLGAFNVHGSLLPRNRGCNPIQWAILNKEFETGVTLHQMDNGIDTGPIVDKKKIPIFFHDSWLDVRKRLAKATNDLLKSNLPQILSGNYKVVPQKNKNASTGRRRIPEDGQFFWSEKIVDIHNKIRALLPPLPTAYYLQRDGMKIEIDKYHTPWKLASYKYDPAVGGQSIKSDCCNLIPLQKKDAQFLLDYLTDRELIAYNAPFNSDSLQELVLWIDNMMDECHDLVVFVIESSENKNPIGICKLFNIDWKIGNANLEIRIGKDFSVNQFLEREIVKTLCCFAFDEMGMQNLKTQVFEEDGKKVKLYENVGFEKEHPPREVLLSSLGGHRNYFLQLSKFRE